MAQHFLIPPEERQKLDALPADRENLYRAWAWGVLYARGEAHAAIGSLPSVFGVFDNEALTFDGPKVEIVEPDRGDAA